MPVRHSRDSKGPYYRRGNSGNESGRTHHGVESEDTTGREQATKAKQQDRAALVNGWKG